MEEGPVSVLVVDDSALMRNLISRIIDSAPDLEVVGRAMNGRFALQKIETLSPDVVVLDLEMPEMNGIEFLQERRNRGLETPVVILSSIAQKGATITMNALALGAADFVAKPSGSVSEDIHTVADQLIELVRGYGRKHRSRQGKRTIPKADRREAAEVVAPPPTAAQAPAEASGRFVPVIPEAQPGRIEIVAIGISTGGPNALRKVFAEMSASLPVPILVVQHMPPGFTEEFAKSLDRVCALEVKEAADGDVVKPGRVLIAPGNRHMKVQRKSLAAVVRISDEGPVNGHRPSCDVLFESVAREYGNAALGVIMTGMGKDGADKLAEIYRRGGYTIGQDAATSVVYGMPRVAFELGVVHQQVGLSDMASQIERIVAEHRA